MLSPTSIRLFVQLLGSQGLLAPKSEFSHFFEAWSDDMQRCVNGRSKRTTQDHAKGGGQAVDQHQDQQGETRTGTTSGNISRARTAEDRDQNKSTKATRSTVGQLKFRVIKTPNSSSISDTATASASAAPSGTSQPKAPE
ncbi:unnamed protein product, partial [Amoebophrya sp. A25]|eukprot:GSA25T00024358001.1